MRAIITILMSISTAALAQGALPVVDVGRIQACFSAAPAGGGLPDCLGEVAESCIDATVAGGTTAGSADCIAAETGVWEGIMNREYRETRIFLGELDLGGAPAGPRSDALRDAQRAWLAFRDADCGARYLRWQDGTIRSAIFASCMLDLTAERTLDLRDFRDEVE